jgi:hypothetical protein
MTKSTQSETSTITRKQRLLMLLPVFTLIVVALNEPRLVRQENLTSWKGGGFGMFATIDRHTWRPVVITLVFADRDGENRKEMQVDIRSYLSAIQDDVDKLQHFEDTTSLPSQHNLGILASQIAEFKYITDQGPYAFVSEEGFGLPVTTRQVTIKLYRLIYDDPTNRGSYEFITSWNASQR